MQYVLLPEGHAVLAAVVIPADVAPTYILMSGKLKLKNIIYFLFFIIIFTQHDDTVPLVEDATVVVVVVVVGIALPWKMFKYITQIINHLYIHVYYNY